MLRIVPPIKLTYTKHCIYLQGICRITDKLVCNTKNSDSLLTDTLVPARVQLIVLFARTAVASNGVGAVVTQRVSGHSSSSLTLVDI